MFLTYRKIVEGSTESFWLVGDKNQSKTVLPSEENKLPVKTEKNILSKKIKTQNQEQHESWKYMETRWQYKIKGVTSCSVLGGSWYVCTAKVTLCPSKIWTNTQFVAKTCAAVPYFDLQEDNIFIVWRVSHPNHDELRVLRIKTLKHNPLEKQLIFLLD